jgi:hypothetical protein
MLRNMNNAANTKARRFFKTLIADLRLRATTETDPAHKARLLKAADWYEHREPV